MDVNFVSMTEQEEKEQTTRMSTLISNIRKSFINSDITVDDSIEVMKSMPTEYPVMLGMKDIEETLGVMLFNVATMCEDDATDKKLTEAYHFIIILFQSAVFMNCTWNQLLTGVRSYITFEKFSEASVEYFTKVFGM